MWLFTQAYIYDSKADIEPSCVLGLVQFLLLLVCMPHTL